MKIKTLVPVLALGMIFTGCNNDNTKEPEKNETEIVEDNKSESPEEDQMDGNQTEETEDSKDNEANEQGVIYTSIYPIYNLTKQIVGDKYEVKNFSSLKTESHGWEPSAKDMAELSEASLMFINGAGMEEWEESVRDSIEVDLVDTSAEVDLLEANHDHDHDHEDEAHEHEDEGHDHEDEAHEHEDEGHDHEDETHEHEDEDHDHEDETHEHEDEDHESHDHNHGMYDPHTWLSPLAGKSQAKLIADKLSEVDPANSSYYMENYDKIAKELDDIISEYQEKFANASHKNFLVNHKAYSYLAHDFGLNQLALTDITSTGDEGARDVKEMIDTANDLGINTVFYEKGTEGKSAQTIADEIGATTKPLNTMEFATDDELANNTTYQELVRENLEALYQSMTN